jgi:CcmD family protein
MEDNALEFLFAGFAVFWAALFVYLILLQTRLRGLQREIDTLEERLAEYEDSEDSEDASAGQSTAPATTSEAAPVASPAPEG